MIAFNFVFQVAFVLNQSRIIIVHLGQSNLHNILIIVKELIKV